MQTLPLLLSIEKPSLKILPAAYDFICMSPGTCWQWKLRLCAGASFRVGFQVRSRIDSSSFCPFQFPPLVLLHACAGALNHVVSLILGSNLELVMHGAKFSFELPLPLSPTLRQKCVALTIQAQRLHAVRQARMSPRCSFKQGRSICTGSCCKLA